jgi:hypothetical protein
LQRPQLWCPAKARASEKARAELDEQDTTSVTETSAPEGEEEQEEDGVSPLKDARRGSTATAASLAQRSAATSGGSEGWDEDASEIPWEFTIDSSSSLRQSKTKIVGQRRRSSLRQSKRTSELTIDKLQFARLDNLYGRDRECRLLQEAWEGLRNKDPDTGASKKLSGDFEPAASASARAKVPSTDAARRVVNTRASLASALRGAKASVPQ